MHEVAMQEKVGNKLVWTKKFRQGKIESHVIGETQTQLLIKYSIGKPEDGIYDKQIFDNQR